MMLGGNPGTTLNPDSPATNLLYTGEMYDAETQNYYLRARYYNPSTGSFNRTDPFAGNNLDPQSLHKYAYAHNNPVNMIDPSGKFSWLNVGIGVIVGLLILRTIQTGINIIQSLIGRSGTCGQDVTQQLIDLSNDFDYKTDPTRMNDDERRRRCKKRRNFVTGWDINILHSKLVGGATGSCHGTATVSGKCYDQSAINYYLWGKICKYCGDTEFEAVLKVYMWKVIRGGERRAILQAYDFTSAGFHSWQDFDQPPLNTNDHRNCSPNLIPWKDLRFIDHYHWGQGGAPK